MTSVVYFLASAGLIKIGYTTDLNRRVRTLQTASATEIVVVGAAPGGLDLERNLHHELAEHRVRGEWFTDCEAVRAVATREIARQPVPPSAVQDAPLRNQCPEPHVVHDGDPLTDALQDATVRFGRLIDIVAKTRDKQAFKVLRDEHRKLDKLADRARDLDDQLDPIRADTVARIIARAEAAFGIGVSP